MFKRRAGIWVSHISERCGGCIVEFRYAKGLVRYQQTGDFHFVTFSCYRRQLFLRTVADRNLFEWSLEAMRIRYWFYVAGYVVMPEYLHLLVSEPREALLAKALQALNCPWRCVPSVEHPIS